MKKIKKKIKLVKNSDYYMIIHLTKEYTDLGFFDVISGSSVSNFNQNNI